MPAIVKTGAVNPNAATVLWQALTPTVTATNAVEGSPAINLIDPATWSEWLGSASNTSAQYDFGSAVSVNGFGISGHAIASTGVEYRVQYSNNGTTWTTIHSETPLTDDDILCIFPSVSARYWRLYFPSAPATVAVFVVANRLIFPHSPVADYKPLHHARKYTKMFNDSVSGSWLGTRVMAGAAETNVNMGFFDRAWLEANIRPFEYHYGQGGTFFFAGSPGLYPLDVGYCRASSDDGVLEIEWTEADKMATLEFEVRAYVG